MGGNSSKEKADKKAKEEAEKKPETPAPGTNAAAAAKGTTPRPGSGTPRKSNPPTYRERLVAFYEKYNPEKLANVDAILAEWKGTEEQLFEKLRTQYGPEPIVSPKVSAKTTARRSKKGKPTVEEWRVRYARFFEFYDPGKLPIVDALLEKSVGREEDTMQKMIEKYGPEPPGADDQSALPTERAPANDDAQKKAAEDEQKRAEVIQRAEKRKKQKQMEEAAAAKAAAEEAEKALAAQAARVAEAEIAAQQAAAAERFANERVTFIGDEQAERQVRQEQEHVERNSLHSFESQERSAVLKKESERVFQRRLSGYLGVRAPHKLKMTSEAVKRYGDESEDLMTFLKNSFGAEPSEAEIRAYFAKRLEKFYDLHDPKKSPNAREEMGARVGFEEEYMQELIARYGDDPSLYAADQPSPQEKAKEENNSNNTRQSTSAKHAHLFDMGQKSDDFQEASNGSETNSYHPKQAEEARVQSYEPEVRHEHQDMYVDEPIVQHPPAGSRQDSSFWWDGGRKSSGSRMKPSEKTQDESYNRRSSYGTSPMGRRRVSDMIVHPSNGNREVSPPTLYNVSKNNNSSRHQEQPFLVDDMDHSYPYDDHPSHSNHHHQHHSHHSGLVDEFDPTGHTTDDYGGLLEAKREAEELRRIAHEQQKLLMEHVAEADRLRRMLATQTSVNALPPSPTANSPMKPRIENHPYSQAAQLKPIEEELDELLEPTPRAIEAPAPVITEQHVYSRPPVHTAEASATSRPNMHFSNPSTPQQSRVSHPYGENGAPLSNNSSMYDSPFAGKSNYPNSPTPNGSQSSPPPSRLQPQRSNVNSYSGSRTRNANLLPPSPPPQDADLDQTLEDLLFGDGLPPPNAQSNSRRKSAPVRQPSPLRLRMMESHVRNSSSPKSVKRPEAKTLEQLREEYEQQRGLMSSVDKNIKDYRLVSS